MQGSSAAYSHQQLINWCVEFSQAFYDAKLSANQCKALSALADDISVQWELYIASVYSLEQMARIDLNDLILPKQQFQHWQTLLETLLNEFETP